MSKIVTIPTDGMNPFVVTHNGEKYVFTPGETVEVSDGVALEIEEYKRWREKFFPKEPALIHAQPDLSQNDPNAADYVKNRTHYEETTVVNEPLNITWDGNTEGLVKAEGAPFYKVSDAVLTDEQIKSATASFSFDDIVIPLESAWDNALEGSISDEIVMMIEFLVFVRKDGAVIYDSLAFPECGIYFLYDGPDAYTSSLTTTEPVEHTKTVVHKLDKKFLPDNIGGGIKYVTIGMDDNDDYTASATYDEIAEWINAGIDVKCIYGKHILPLVYSDAVGGISMMEMMVRHEFACIGPNTEGNPGPVFLDVRIEEYKNRVEVSEIWLSEAT